MSTQITDSLTNVREKYHINAKEIGHGHYGVVRKCRDRATDVEYAIKSIKKEKVSNLLTLMREVAILQNMDHPHIIKLIEVHEDQKYLHLITELCTGGELFERIMQKTESAEGHFSENDAAKLLRDIVEAIRYCHDLKVVHRDLKPENFLFQTRDENSPIKIIDFGLSRYEDPSEDFMKTKVGTPYYVAPEVLKKQYDKGCDMWSIGVIAYIVLCGYPPFYGDNDLEIFGMVTRAEYDYPSPEWDDISCIAKDFINKLLQVDPSKRLTAMEALDHSFIRSFSQNPGHDVHYDNDRSLIYQKSLGLKKLQKQALTVIAESLTSSEIGSLDKIFQAIDTDSDGKLSLQEIAIALRHGNYPPQMRKNLDDIMINLAVDGNDSIDWKEFLTETIDINIAMREDNVRLVFDTFRTNNNSYLEVSDLIHIFGGEAQTREVVGEIDLNGDGQISFDEFCIALANSFH